MSTSQAVAAPRDRDRQQTGNEQALEAQLGRIRAELRKWNRGDVLGRHRVGRLVHQMLGAPGRYGQRLVPRLVEAIGFSESWFYECRLVAETWGEADLGELLKRRDRKRDLPLNWSHLVLLASLTDGPERRRWINETLREGLTAGALRARLNAPPGEDAGEEEADGEEAAGDARRASRWLRDIRVNAETVLSKQRQWQTTLLEALDTGAEFDERARQEAQATLERARQAKEGYETLIERLEQAVEGG